MILIGNIVTSEQSFYGEIEFSHKILNIRKVKETITDANWIFPGFLDLHVHGGGGADLMEGEVAIRKMLRTHLKHGTTSLLATTVTEEKERLKEAFYTIRQVFDNPAPNESRMLGVHLEGPFLSDQKLGAQPNFVRKIDLEEIKELHSICPIRVMTVAPESGLNKYLINELMRLNIKVQLGHSNSSYEESLSLLQAGADSVTHLFNAMSSMHHRAPGLVGATLAHANKAEIIPDLLHVHPGAIKVALRSIPNLYFVTDATAATAMPDGQYQLGSHKVHKCANGVRLADGTLAGSSLTMAQALKNAISLGLDEIECAKRLATIQANYLQQDDCGKLEVNKRADIVVTTSDYNLLETYLAGNKA